MNQGNEGNGNGDIEQGVKLSYDASVDSVSWHSYLTGPNAPVNTLENWQVGGTDLGFPIYNSKNGKMYVAFGDTFLKAQTQQGLWRSNVVGVTQDFDFSDGIAFDTFLGNGDLAQSIFEGIHQDKFEMTKIPTGGIEVNGVMYYFYFSKYSWNVDSRYSMNYGGAVKSKDEGKTWERVNDLSWLDNSMPDRKDEIEKLANQNIFMQDGEKIATMETHSGYSFTQIFPIDGKDGYVYILGEGGYRQGGIRLGRVAYADIEQFEKYEYFNGTDKDGEPIWLKGHAGLVEVEKNKSSYIVSDRCSEQSAMWNEYLKKWMVVYLQDVGAGGGGILYRVADNIYGPYSEPRTLVPYSFPFENDVHSIYAGIVHEKWTEQNGKVFYLVISQWMPVYNSSFMKIVLK